jgi:hypothetical protein
METQEFVAMVAKLDENGQLDGLLELVGERVTLVETLDEISADRKAQSSEELASRDERDGELMKAKTKEDKKLKRDDYRHDDPEVREESWLADVNDNEARFADLIEGNRGEAAMEDLERRIEDVDTKIANLVATAQLAPKQR